MRKGEREEDRSVLLMLGRDDLLLLAYLKFIRRYVGH